ncbi:T9SS type A sorting domain-containing protein [Rubrivirga sp. S365]|uniref:T9SS type A sorting domain-containing protein n=1 Tax=Rubrivirga sp. S365 TaxID=3076080 RepID=UPI0028C9C051|nr:T9SS type A sorting domain-containing protein [Rubrivirga sp. S365]MDT7856556.1 T9SS type A sorting domain-containing protein [Rubrivirga sp. S365]
MRTATPIPTHRLSLFLIAVFALALTSGAAAQSPLVVEPGPGTLNAAIENDTDRPADRVYVLQRGAYYGVTREINNQGYTLRIRAADGDGNRPVVHPGINAQGKPVASRYFNLARDTYFTGIYFLAVNPQGGENATSFALNAEGMRFVVDDCVFQGGGSRLIEVNVDDTKLYFTDSQFRNLIRNDGSSNGRPIDYRTVTGDSLVVENTSFLNISGYLVRYDGPVLENAIFNHVTVYGTGRDLTTNAFATQAINFRFTNNLVVNPYGFGQAPPEEGEVADGVVRIDSLDADIASGFTEADRRIVVENNGYMITDDLQAFYDARTASGDPLVAYALIDDALLEYAAANPSVVLNENETYDIDFTNPPNLDDYIAFLRAFRNGATDPGTWTFGSDDLFPADQPPPEDLSYPASNPAYTASQLGFPLGDLNYFPPAVKAAWEAAGGMATDADDDPSQGGFVLRGTAPNPSAGVASLRMDLDQAASVAVEVFDVLGRRVLSVPSTTVPAGQGHTVRLDGSSLPSGLYVARVAADTGGAVRVQTVRFTIAR